MRAEIDGIALKPQLAVPAIDNRMRVGVEAQRIIVSRGPRLQQRYHLAR
jgi:hypothetical protein